MTESERSSRASSARERLVGDGVDLATRQTDILELDVRQTACASIARWSAVRRSYSAASLLDRRRLTLLTILVAKLVDQLESLSAAP
jgi:hypothetical protein